MGLPLRLPLRLLLHLILLMFCSFAHADAADRYESAKVATTTSGRFSERLFPILQHPRCINCHQFGSFRNNGRSFNSHRSRYLCDGCHKPQLIGLPPGEWMAPPPTMDYTGLNARQTCELIKRNMGSPYSNERLRHHMLNDLRIRWALEGGMTPDGQRPTVEGGYAAWAEAVQDWAASGMACD